MQLPGRNGVGDRCSCRSDVRTGAIAWNDGVLGASVSLLAYVRTIRHRSEPAATGMHRPTPADVEALAAITWRAAHVRTRGTKSAG